MMKSLVIKRVNLNESHKESFRALVQSKAEDLFRASPRSSLYKLVNRKIKRFVKLEFQETLRVSLKT